MDFEEKLIEEVRNHKIIYDLEDKQYRQVDKKDRIWMDIARGLNTNVDICKKKWKNLRDTYKKLRRQDFLQSGSSAPEVKRKWKYLELLSFLDGYGVPRPTLGNVPPEEDEVMDSTWEDPNVSNASVDATIHGEDLGISLPSSSESLIENRDSPHNSRPSTSSSVYRRTPRSRVPSKKRADDEINQQFEEFMSVATTNIAEACKVQPKDSTSLLFESLAAKISKADLSEDVVSEIEAEVTAIIYNKLADYRN